MSVFDDWRLVETHGDDRSSLVKVWIFAMSPLDHRSDQAKVADLSLKDTEHFPSIVEFHCQSRKREESHSRSAEDDLYSFNACRFTSRRSFVSMDFLLLQLELVHHVTSVMMKCRCSSKKSCGDRRLFLGWQSLCLLFLHSSKWIDEVSPEGFLLTQRRSSSVPLTMPTLPFFSSTLLTNISSVLFDSLMTTSFSWRENSFSVHDERKCPLS